MPNAPGQVYAAAKQKKRHRFPSKTSARIFIKTIQSRRLRETARENTKTEHSIRRTLSCFHV